MSARAGLELDDLMDFAVRTVQRAGEITLDHFGSAAVERKGDGSEVTAADRASEAFVQAAIRERFPDDAILGEEGAAVQGTSGRRWIVDPIDATRSFACGVPLYGVLLALEVGGEAVLGCCHMPALDETLVAATGAGAWLNGRPTRVSSVARLDEARVVTSGLEYWRDWSTEAGLTGWNRLLASARFGRTWGDCYGYFLVATGRVDVLADPASGNAWDYAPMLPILREAGGRFTALGGGPVRAWSTALATNGVVHDAAAGCWGGLPDDELQTEAVRERREG
ncbi:MAG TPA: inositol monophosphatase family protein [Longimicrobiaceae bacterium]|nr:inositol monophosphatase family protein [Longimicrobiaceae bacterium]